MSSNFLHPAELGIDTIYASCYKLRMDIIPTTGVVVFNTNKQVLLVEHISGASHIAGTFGLPAGRIEEDETAQQAAFRELQEETGITTELHHLHKLPKEYEAKIKRKDGTTKLFTFTVFVCTKYKGELKESEETMPRWIDADKLDGLNLLPNVKEAILESIQFTK